MSSMRFNVLVRLDTSHHAPPHLFKDAGAAADSLTDTNNAMKCLFVDKRSCTRKGF
jgi:hypothetical protein